MTDTFIVDEHGAFVVGKAQTTPDDESVGFIASARDALGQWGSRPEDGFATIVSGIYSGTAMLNRLLQRQGLKIGCIVNAGHEDYLRLERGIQTYLGTSYSDRLHLATHFHNEPLVPRERMKGVRGRIDVFGDEVLPLREEDAREAARALLAQGVRGHRRLAAVRVSQSRTRDACARDRRRGEGRGGRRRLGADVPLERAVPDASRSSTAELDGDRGLRRGAVALDAQGGPRGDQGERRAVRATRDGRTRRDRFDRGARTRAHARIGSDRRRRRRACARAAHGHAATSCAPISAARRSTSR